MELVDQQNPFLVAESQINIKITKLWKWTKWTKHLFTHMIKQSQMSFPIFTFISLGEYELKDYRRLLVTRLKCTSREMGYVYRGFTMSCRVERVLESEHSRLVWILTLPLNICIILGKFYNLSKSVFSFLKRTINIYF